MKNEKGTNQKSLKNWMKYIMIFSIGIFLWQTSSAQGWINYYDDPSLARRSFGVVNGEGAYVLFENKPSREGFDIVSVNILGDEIWRVPFRNTSNWVNNYVQCYDVVRSGTEYIFLVARESLGLEEFGLVKMSATGELLSEATIFSPNYDVQGSLIHYGQIELLENGNLVVSRTIEDFIDSGFSIRNDVIIVDEQANLQNTLLENDSEQWLAPAYDIQSTSDGGAILVWIGMVRKYDAFGNLEWEDQGTWGAPTSIVETPDGGFVYMGEAGFDIIRLSKIDANGEDVWQQTIEGSITFSEGDFLHIDPSGDLFFIGANGPQVTLYQTDAFGNLVWKRDLDLLGYGYTYLSTLLRTENDGFLIAGSVGTLTQIPGGWLIPKNHNFLLSTDSLPNKKLFNTTIFDANNNCQIETSEPPLSNIPFKILTPDSLTIIRTTNDDGKWDLPVLEGTYIISTLLDHPIWEPCQDTVMVEIDADADSTYFDYLFQATQLSPYLEVDINTSFLRRCFQNYYTVEYCNTGSIAAEDAYIEITLDEHLTLNSASIPWSQQNGNVYTFDLGTIEVGLCEKFELIVTVECSAELGESLCAEAHIFPDTTLLPPSPNWSGALIEVDYSCGDSLYFHIQNTGENGMPEALDYIIIEDAILRESGQFQLEGGMQQEISVPANGATYYIAAEQEMFAPSVESTMLLVEGCDPEGNGSSFGFSNQFPLNTIFGAVDIDCREVIGAYDPNDKVAFPEGFGDNHIITKDQDLEYQIRFQNTGTDTAFTVVIIDTLSHFLDANSVRPLSSSHDYDFTILPGGIARFTFENIMLPDSNVNEVLSHGFVKFHVQQQANNQIGTIINNDAEIYFDFNAPIVTPPVRHEVGKVNTMHQGHVNICEGSTYSHNGWEINIDTMIYDTVDLNIFRDITLTEFFIEENYEIDIDTILAPGDIYFGNLIAEDTTWVENLLTIHGCDSLININVTVLSTAVKTDLKSKVAVKIYPNPFSTQATMEVIGLENNADASVKILDRYGRLLREQTLNNGSTQIDGKDLIPGIYFYQILTANKLLTQGKLMIQ